MLARDIPKAITVVDGTPAIGRDFGGVDSVAASYLFDARGNEVLRVGGDPGPPGRHALTRQMLEDALSRLH